MELRWRDVSGPLELLRRLPQDESYTSLGAVDGTAYRDTLRRAVCGDTLHYRLIYGGGAMIETSVWFADAVPPLHSDIQIVSVDSLADSVVVSWLPSKSEDVAAYIICTGTSADSCGGTLTARWNDYRNMPGGMGKYCLYYSLGRPYVWRLADSTSGNSLRIPMPEDVYDSCHFRLCVSGLESGLFAYSNTASVAVGDTSNVECGQSHHGDIDPDSDLFALPNALIYGQPPNDRFLPCPTGVLPEGVSGYRLDIFCRTGRRVFRSENPAEAFTGHHNGRELQGGAYVYLLFYSVGGVQQVRKGQLLLLK